MTTEQQNLEIIKSILMARVNILCLGDDFSVSLLEGAIPGISDVVTEYENIQKKNLQNLNRLIMILPTDSQPSKYIGSMHIDGRVMDVIYVYSVNFNSISLTICRDSLCTNKVVSVYRNTEKICADLLIDKVIVFAAGMTFDKGDIELFIKDTDDNGHKKFLENGIDVSIVCAYGRNSNAATDQGSSIAETAIEAVAQYKKIGANATSICTYRNDNIISDWATAFGLNNTNKVVQKIASLKKQIQNCRKRVNDHFDLIKESFEREDKSIDVEKIIDNPIFMLKDIEYIFPSNFRETLKKIKLNQIKQYLLDNLKI